MRVIDLTGHRIGLLTVLYRDGTRNTFAAWRVRCDCGIEKTVSGHDLRKPGRRACGCQTTDAVRAAATTHGQTGTRTWRSWNSMVHRCMRPADPSWDRYGGRGIRICDRWLGPIGFENFLADMGERPSSKTLDRVDVNGNYEPKNCRWATRNEQDNNKRTNLMLTLNGKRMSVSDWAHSRSMRPGTLFRRLHYGWSVEDAIMRPVDPRTPRRKLILRTSRPGCGQARLAS